MHSSEVRSVRFRPSRGGVLGALLGSEGYSADEVDAFMERCARALEARESRSVPPPGAEPLVTADEIVLQEFRYVRFGRGYNADEVDDVLDRIVLQLRAADPQSAVDATAEEPGVVSERVLTSADVRGRAFATRGMGAVDIAEVDAFIARCADALAAHESGRPADLDARAVAAARFTPTTVVLGYDSAEVDVFLGDVAAALIAYEGPGRGAR